MSTTEKSIEIDLPFSVASPGAVLVRLQGTTNLKEDERMKYALLIHDVPGGWKGLGDEERTAIMGEYLAITRHPGIVGGEQLHGAAAATTVQVSDGVTVTTAGPFADTEEFVGGFYLLQADDLDAAIALAARVPAARMGGSVEIRPVVER